MKKRLLFALIAVAIVIGGLAYLLYLGCEMSEWRTWLLEDGRCQGIRRQVVSPLAHLDQAESSMHTQLGDFRTFPDNGAAPASVGEQGWIVRE